MVQTIPNRCSIAASAGFGLMRRYDMVDTSRLLGA
jgi:hypothetical protein